jgi:hypothetical protein
VKRVGAGKEAQVRTKLSVCNRKVRYPSEAEALLATQRSGLELRLYRCDRCRLFHLTSRTKGKRVLPAGARAVIT